MLLQAFAVGEHLEADVTLLRFCPRGNGFDASLVEVDHGVVLQLTHLVEALVADVTHELLEVHVGLMVRLEDLGEHGPVIVAEAAEEHVTVPAMATPKMGRHVSPLVRAHLTTWLLAAEPTNLLLVAAQVVVKLLLLFEKEGTILERARQLSLFMIRLQFVWLQFLGMFSFQQWFLQTGRRWWWWVNTWN